MTRVAPRPGNYHDGMAASLSLDVGGQQVSVTNPDKVVFPDFNGRPSVTKLDLIDYYLAVADGALRGVANRPMILKRFVKGITEEAVFQKRAPEKRPDYVDVAELKYASGTSAKEAVIHDAAGLAWAINMGCVDLNPHPVQADDLAHPDELRVDLDPMPGVDWKQIVDVALVAREVLEDHGLTGWPKTSGSRGFHIYARIQPRWPFKFVRLAAQTVAREVERRVPELGDRPVVEGGTRGGVRRLQPERLRPHRRVGVLGARAAGCAGVDATALGRGRRAAGPRQFTIATVPARFAEIGDPWESWTRPPVCWIRFSTLPTGSGQPRRRRRVPRRGPVDVSR